MTIILYQVIENKSNFTIQITAYAPQAFLFFRDLLAISYKHILQFIEMNWNDLSYEEKENLSEYRRYLLDYPQQKDWYKKYPQKYDEWKSSK